MPTMMELVSEDVDELIREVKFALGGNCRLSQSMAVVYEGFQASLVLREEVHCAFSRVSQLISEWSRSEMYWKVQLHQVCNKEGKA